MPDAGTAAVLIMIGAILFQNVSKLDWYVVKDAVPSFVTLFFIVSTYNILEGAAIGYITYVCIHLFTGDLEITVRRQMHNFLHPELSDTRRAVTRRADGRLSYADNAPPTFVEIEHSSYISQFFHNLSKAMDQADENDLVNMGAVADVKKANEDDATASSV